MGHLDSALPRTGFLLEHCSATDRGTRADLPQIVPGHLTDRTAMPYFCFDLVIGKECRNQGGMILENWDAAAERADSLAGELAILRPDLKEKGCSVRVVNDDDQEVYRISLNPVPPWRSTTRG
jgi:hypothetical protein